jgi:hypothetical protein
MATSNFNQGILYASLLFVSAASHAEIFKWVDEKGQTHYSERKEDAGKAKAVELKVKGGPESKQAPYSPAQDWQEQERQFKQRQLKKLNEKPAGPPADTRPKALSNGRSDDTDASRCNLARDVISGAVRHPNGKPTDDYDRAIAENDIRSFCH